MLRLVAAITAVVFLAGVAIAFTQPGTSERRFKVTAELRLDGKIYTGSAVWSLSASFDNNSGLSDPSGPTLEVRGDAIDFALPDGQTLFLLRRGKFSPPSKEFGGEFLVCVPGNTTFEMARSLATFNGSCAIGLYPEIVLADKNGILSPLPYTSKTKSGRRISIVSTLATTTDEPISTGIVDRHPWISDLPHAISGGMTDITYFEDFSRR